jgi:hypothetical protein
MRFKTEIRLGVTHFCQPVVDILGLVEGRDSFSKDGEDNLGRGNRRIEAQEGQGARLGLSWFSTVRSRSGVKMGAKLGYKVDMEGTADMVA